MRKNDTPRPKALDIVVALALLTRLPLPKLSDTAFDRQAQAAWAFPLVGVVVALVAVAVGQILYRLGLPPAAAAGGVLATQMVVTGAMHEDGLADTVDGLWGGWTRERRLDIMKDSAIGTYGVLALILSVGLRWAALEMLIPLGYAPVFAAAILSRAVLPLLMTILPHARTDGLSHSVGAPAAWTASISALLGLGLAVLTLGLAVVPAVLSLALAVAILAWLARRKIGGQTGDILGAAQQLGEIAVLLTLLALFSV